MPEAKTCNRLGISFFMPLGCHWRQKQGVFPSVFSLTKTT